MQCVFFSKKRIQPQHAVADDAIARQVQTCGAQWLTIGNPCYVRNLQKASASFPRTWLRWISMTTKCSPRHVNVTKFNGNMWVAISNLSNLETQSLSVIFSFCCPLLRKRANYPHYSVAIPPSSFSGCSRCFFSGGGTIELSSSPRLFLTYFWARRALTCWPLGELLFSIIYVVLRDCLKWINQNNAIPSGPCDPTE